MVKQKRKQLYIDPQVQGPIVRRVIVYWSACISFVMLPMLLARVVADPSVFVLNHVPGLIAQYWPILMCMTVMLPLAVLDALKLSNRFAGPIFRIRHELKKHNEGQPVNKIVLRSDDYWHDIANEFNKFTDRVQQATASDEFPSQEAEPELVGVDQ